MTNYGIFVIILEFLFYLISSFVLLFTMYFLFIKIKNVRNAVIRITITGVVVVSFSLTICFLIFIASEIGLIHKKDSASISLTLWLLAVLFSNSYCKKIFFDENKS